MKKTFTFCLAILFLLNTFGCAAKPPEPTFTPTTAPNLTTTPTETATPLSWNAQYIRTDGGQENAKFPQVQIIAELQDLQDYYTIYQELFDLDRREQVYSDTTIGFLDACDRYDETFFAEKYLLFVLLEESSGSIRHSVSSVELTPEKQVSISIQRNVPEVGTDDMAQWHIILELPRDAIVESPKDIMVYWVDGRLAFHEYPIVQPKPFTQTEPPDVLLTAPTGQTVVLSPAGYEWNYQEKGGLATTVIADQVARPLPSYFMESVLVDPEFGETVEAYATPGVSGPSCMLGYLMKLQWQVAPTSVTYTCWRYGQWNSDVEHLPDQHAFYARIGHAIYEICATWEDTGAGYHGTANYYVQISDYEMVICDDENLTGEEYHTHAAALRPQTVDDPIVGYCGNTQTTLHLKEGDYSFMYGHSVTLTDILANLKYDPNKTCRCMAEFTVDTEFGTGYAVNLDRGFVRCQLGQADLTPEQIRQIAAIVDWAVTTNCTYPTS